MTAPMTTAPMTATSATGLSRPARWLLLGSIAFNLFFIGVVAAFLIRAPAPDRVGVAGRIEQMAQSLPPADADKLRASFGKDRPSVEGARTDFESARNTIRADLRREPFDAGALRDSMGKARAARQEFDQRLQDVIAKAAAEMSAAGRQALAQGPPAARQR